MRYRGKCIRGGLCLIFLAVSCNVFNPGGVDRGADENDVDALINDGMHYLREDKPGKALQIFLKATEVDPTRSKAWERAAAAELKIAKLNVDRNRKTPKEYNITGIPTFMAIKNGEILETKVGALSKKKLSEMIKKLLD